MPLKTPKPRSWGWLLAALLVFAPPAFADVQLDEISRLAREGTPHLAVRILDEHQPSVQTDPTAWARWERERISIYQLQGDSHAVLTRLRRLPRKVPADFVVWAETTMSEAEVNTGQGRSARERLARLVWGQPRESLAAHLVAWRRLIIRSYLTEGRIEDAQAAMLRYQLDYGDSSEEWKLLRARVLVRAGRAEEAERLLKDLTGLEARVLRLLASSRSGHIRADKLNARVERLLQQQGLEPALAYQLWGTLAEAARRDGNGEMWITALEHAVALVHRTLVADSPVQPDADVLWTAYETYAQELANAQQLLVGNHPAWFALADSLVDKQPTRARAVYAYLALNADDGPASEEAHHQLVDLHAGERGAQVLRQLYLKSGRFPDVESIPRAARYGLVEQAVGERDIVLASRLMAGLDQAPTGTDAMTWSLQRARVQILGGHQTRGIAMLRELIATRESLSPEMVERANQVIFDLQTLGEHQTAYDIFSEVLVRTSDARAVRELQFWMADSLAAMGRPVAAARLYLRSAMVPEPHAMDAWAQTARYRAAEALGEAGLRDDARFLYEGLLAVTEEPDRQAVLRRAIQQLWLKGDLAPVKLGHEVEAPARQR